MKDKDLQFDRKCHVLYSKACKKQILACGKSIRGAASCGK